jgi:exonuclease V gamma subunit
MHVFLANPCAEFWEDVDTRRHRGKLRRAWTSNSDATCAGIAPRSPDDYGKEELKDLDQPPPTRDHSLLELWGNAGKANIFLWCARALWNFEYHSPSWVETEKHPDSLLKTVQYSLLRCSNELPRGLLADNSLQVLACADPGREVEELREHILDLVKSASVDYLTEIVVYVADIGAYVSHIQRVFGAFRQDDAEYIPFSVLGAPGTNSVFAQGMHTLLKIFEGHFDRAHVFALLRNQIVQCTRRFSPDNVAVWESWAEELGIFRGYNRRQREEMGDRGETATDSHTFELGIARLLIGNLAADPADMNLTLLAGDNAPAFIPIPPFRNFDTSDFDSIEAFCKLVEDLYICVSTLRACGTLSDSVDVAIKIVGDWMSVIPEEQTWNLAVEGRIRNEFLEALPAIKLQNSLGKREEPTQISEFVALALQCLPEELPAGSKAWSGGITFAPLRPAMIVPHKVVFALGLDATAFPGVSDKPGWDLLSHKQIVGDSDPVRDNRFAFLELLHAAQERLVLSFRARNMQKEELLQPSSVVCELESYLSQQGLRIPDEVLHEARCSVRRDIPWIVRESLENLVTPERFWGSWEASTVRLACIERETGMRTARHRHGTRFEAPAHPTANHVQTTAYDLRLFIANPLEYHLSRTLGLDIDEQPATMCATDEPLQSGALEMSELQKEIWSQLLALAFPENAMDSLETPEELADKAEDIARAVHADYVIRGCSPEAQLCSMEGQFLVNWARQCAAITLDLRTRFGSHKLLVNAGMSLGRPWMTGFVSIDMGEGKDCAVDCRHGFALVPRSAIGEIGIIAVKKEGDAKSNPDLWLTGTLQWLAEQHSERPDACTVQRVQLNRGNGKEQKAGWSAAPLAHTAPLPLRIWLADRIREMLLDRCADHLPFAVVKDITKQSKRNPISWDQRFAKVTVAGVEEKLSDGVHSPYSCFLEGFKLAEARIPFSDEPDKIRRDEKLLDLVKRRFAVMLKDMDP